MSFNARIKNKRDTASNWETNNPVLLDGELIIVDTNAGDVRFKIGDGTKTYKQLPFQDESLYSALSGKAEKDVYDPQGKATDVFAYVDNAVDESVVKYNLSKDGTTIVLTGTDDSVSEVEESVTTATDDGAGNVVLESVSAIAHVDDAVKQEIVNATIASLKTETLTFTLDDGTTVTKEVVVK